MLPSVAGVLSVVTIFNWVNGITISFKEQGCCSDFALKNFKKKYCEKISKWNTVNLECIWAQKTVGCWLLPKHPWILETFLASHAFSLNFLDRASLLEIFWLIETANHAFSITNDLQLQVNISKSFISQCVIVRSLNSSSLPDFIIWLYGNEKERRVCIFYELKEILESIISFWWATSADDLSFWIFLTIFLHKPQECFLQFEYCSFDMTLKLHYYFFNRV